MLAARGDAQMNRVHDILQRIQANPENVEGLKACCGALAILAKDEGNKLLIARDGTRLILTVMEAHRRKADMQEAVCDLLWSLAFNNSLVKEVVGRQGGISLILKGLSLHIQSADLVKSACGALSNMCQNAYNQKLIADHGGVRSILAALTEHKANATLLPFIFDALASMVVGNERNVLLVAELSGVKAVLGAMSLHNGRHDVVKSGCHALAILSDVPGQGTRIAEAGGVRVLLPALRLHIRASNLHRIAAIVLLRMLQEAEVAKDIAAAGGVVTVLAMLREHIKEVETVAATVHILYLITHADLVTGQLEKDVEAQLRAVGKKDDTCNNNNGSIMNGNIGGEEEIVVGGAAEPLLRALQTYQRRKDIVRAGMRSLANLVRMAPVCDGLLDAGSTLSAVPTVLLCAALHRRSIGTADSAAAVTKTLLEAAHARVSTSANKPALVSPPPAPTAHRNSLRPRNSTSSTRNTTSSNSNLASANLLPPGVDLGYFGLSFAYRGSPPRESGPGGGGGWDASGGAGGVVAAGENYETWAACALGLCTMLKSKQGTPLGAGLLLLGMDSLIKQWAAAVTQPDAGGRSGATVAPVIAPLTLSPLLNTPEPEHRGQRRHRSGPVALRETALECVVAATDWGRAAVAAISAEKEARGPDGVATSGSGVWCGKHAMDALARWGMCLERLMDEVCGCRVFAASRKTSGGSEVARLVGQAVLLCTPEKPSSAAATTVTNTTESNSSTVNNTGEGEISSNGNASAERSAAEQQCDDGVAEASARAHKVLHGLLEMMVTQPVTPATAPAQVTAEPETPALTIAQRSNPNIVNGVRRDSTGSISQHSSGSIASVGSRQFNPFRRQPMTSVLTAHHSNNVLNARKQQASPSPSPAANPPKGLQSFKNSTGEASAQSSSAPLRWAADNTVGNRRNTNSSGGYHTSIDTLDTGLCLTAWPTLEVIIPGQPPPAPPPCEDAPESPRGPEQLWQVYEGASAAGRGTQSRIQAAEPYDLEPPPVGAVSPYAHSVTFDSTFESGNLLRAVQRGPAEYDLFLRPDLHTHGHTQWFYFSVRNTHPPDADSSDLDAAALRPTQVVFNIVNLTKPDSLFSGGMRPVLYSHREAQGLDSAEPRGWRRCAEDITYSANGYTCQRPDGTVGNFYTLSFRITFPWPGDIYRLAHCYPYTHADHLRHMKLIETDETKARHIVRTPLCQTLSGLDCELLTITADAAVAGATALEGKRCVVISARVHPGEVPASWMMRGMLDFLTGPCEEARLLRGLFVFRIVPLLNPDGVIYGNNRCSLAGVDLNRQWRRPNRTLHPTVYHLKQLLRSEHAKREVVMYIDLHGHSRKQNIFLYGADERRKGLSRPAARVFPKIVSWNRIGRKYVSLKDCSFAVKKGRESTARVVVARELGIENSYTVESTFCGVDFGPLAGNHLNTDHLQEAGRAICLSILDTYLPNHTHRLELHMGLLSMQDDAVPVQNVTPEQQEDVPEGDEHAPTHEHEPALINGNNDGEDGNGDVESESDEDSTGGAENAQDSGEGKGGDAEAEEEEYDDEETNTSASVGPTVRTSSPLLPLPMALIPTGVASQISPVLVAGARSLVVASARKVCEEEMNTHMHTLQAHAMLHVPSSASGTSLSLPPTRDGLSASMQIEESSKASADVDGVHDDTVLASKKKVQVDKAGKRVGRSSSLNSSLSDSLDATSATQQDRRELGYTWGAHAGSNTNGTSSNNNRPTARRNRVGVGTGPARISSSNNNPVIAGGYSIGLGAQNIGDAVPNALTTSRLAVKRSGSQRWLSDGTIPGSHSGKGGGSLPATPSLALSLNHMMHATTDIIETRNEGNSVGVALPSVENISSAEVDANRASVFARSSGKR